MTKAWAFYLLHLIVLAQLGFVATTTTWAMVSGEIELSEKGAAGIIFVCQALFFCFLITVLFTRIEVDAEGVKIKTPLSFGGGTFYSFDELRQAKWRMGGRALNLSGIWGDYFIIPLGYKELAEEIREGPPLRVVVRRERGPKRLDYAVIIVPVLLLTLMGYAFRFYGFYLNSLVYGTLWGMIAFVSESVFVYRSWSRYRYRNLGRVGSALVYGLMAAVPLFVLNLLLVFL